MDDQEGSGGRPLEALYRRYADWLRRVLRRRFGAQAAEDLVQEAYVRLARSGKAGEVVHPKALLLRIAVNAGVDEARRAAVGGGAPIAYRETADPDQEETLLLKEIVLGLPPILRDVFLLSRFGGLSYAEIAARLGISVKTVEWRMSRALAICVERLRERE